jgi:hypothetical protein
MQIPLKLVSVGLAKFAYDVTHHNLSASAGLALPGSLIISAVGLLADQKVCLSNHR